MDKKERRGGKRGKEKKRKIRKIKKRKNENKEKVKKQFRHFTTSIQQVKRFCKTFSKTASTPSEKQLTESRSPAKQPLRRRFRGL
jgi:hypothetical protein